jgi:hypothetical protein
MEAIDMMFAARDVRGLKDLLRVVNFNLNVLERRSHGRTEDRAIALSFIDYVREMHMAEDGWSPEEEDKLVRGELRMAAAAYLAPAHHTILSAQLGEPPKQWPFAKKRWHSTGEPMSDAMRAAGFALAEIERCMRRARSEDKD